jgi:four helix bundle protein
MRVQAHDLVLEIYGVTKSFPREELYGVTSQLRRASTSIPTNVAEGCGRRTKRDFAHYLAMSAGSASEVEYLLILSSDLGYVDGTIANTLIAKTAAVRRMIYAYRTKLIAT